MQVNQYVAAVSFFPYLINFASLIVNNNITCQYAYNVPISSEMSFLIKIKVNFNTNDQFGHKISL